MFEMCVPAQGAMQICHAHGELLREVVNITRRDLSAVNRRAAAAVVGVGCDEVLGQVVEDGCQAVVFVEARQSPGRKLYTVS